jgi:prephenate dehydrogenase
MNACPSSRAPSRWSAIAILGVGLIGGSVGLAVRQRRLAQRVVGIGRSLPRLEQARLAGVIDVAATDIAAVADCDLVIVGTPVDQIVDEVRRAARILRPGAVITDAGSVKTPVCRALAEGLPTGVAFVGSHPLAGSEKTGWEHASGELFTDRLCVLTPVDTTPTEAVDTVESFWQSLAMRTKRMSPTAHDAALAVTSHLPHVAAAALASLLSEETCEFAATGFRDTTRIAAGDPSLWTAIVMQNADHVQREIDRLIGVLLQFREATAGGKREDLRALFQRARAARERLNADPGSP